MLFWFQKCSGPNLLRCFISCSEAKFTHCKIPKQIRWFSNHILVSNWCLMFCVFILDLHTPSVLYCPQWAALHHPHTVHCASLCLWLLAQPPIHQQRPVLCLFWFRSRLLWRYIYHQKYDLVSGRCLPFFSLFLCRRCFPALIVIADVTEWPN